MTPYLPKTETNGLKVGYIVEDKEHDQAPLDPRLPLLQHADLQDKLVLLRVDHNVVKKGYFIFPSIQLFHQHSRT